MRQPVAALAALLLLGLAACPASAGRTLLNEAASAAAETPVAPASEEVVTTPAAVVALPTPPTKAEPPVAWLPFRDEQDVWQPATANASEAELATLSLTDLQSPKAYVEALLLSPFAVPKLPLDVIVTNTLKQLGGGELPDSSREWLLLLRGAGDLLASKGPTLLTELLPNATLDPALVQGLPKLKSLVDGALGMLAALPPLEEALAGGAAAMTGGKPAATATPSSAAAAAPAGSSASSGKREAPAVSLAKLPEQLGSVAAKVVGGLAELPDALPPIEEAINPDGSLDVAGLLKAALNVSLPAVALPKPPPLAPLLRNLTRALPAVAQQLGVANASDAGLKSAVRVMEGVINVADKGGLFAADAPRFDLIATLTEMQSKLPPLEQVGQALLSGGKLPGAPRAGAGAAVVPMKQAAAAPRAPPAALLSAQGPAVVAAGARATDAALAGAAKAGQQLRDAIAEEEVGLDD